MSLRSKLVLVLSIGLTLGSVTTVHLQQARDRQRLHQGVLRDVERLQRREENLKLLQEQRTLEEELRRREAQAPPTAQVIRIDGGV
ncbi:protein PET117 homolog, mitochondrial [Gouania willdenowi]|uniref:protein PET117 homolog, mitochondrial n=1 Tax=Gouania willdenowi TaxID=441366 RepID=UPI001056BEBF|nr:protein PET117 homolog, mitochondrial [Gouania willdenowi]